MKELQFTPDDVLFFRDGRPMEGALSGHGARLPEPHVLNGALHAACHRAFGEDADVGHFHRTCSRPRKGRHPSEGRSERFGALVSAGPFPVLNRPGKVAQWLFPSPADVQTTSTEPSIFPVETERFSGSSSLRDLWPLGNRLSPSKGQTPTWISRDGFRAYLDGQKSCEGFFTSESLFAAEHTIGIGIDENGAAGDGRIYSKATLRMREECRLAAYAELPHSHKPECGDLLNELFPEAKRIALGGELRTCTVTTTDPENGLQLPVGAEIDGTRIKWVLLTPSIYPYLPAARRGGGKPHCGGWLPSWIEWYDDAYRVQLLDGPGAGKAKRLRVEPGKPVEARLVAACIKRPLPVTGWANVHTEATENEYKQTGARSTLLAVPAGSIYYFEAKDADNARRLADTLNWHGQLQPGKSPLRIVNRRSTLLGEKGYGLGVCGAWQPFNQ